MLLQTNSYIVPKDKRAQHARLVQRFRQTLSRLGCDHFEAYEQVGANWSPADTTGRFVQLMRFRDRKHQLAVQAAERNDATAQALIKEFCELINFPYQQQQGLFAVGFYHSLLPTLTPRTAKADEPTVGDVSEAEISEDAIGEQAPRGPSIDPKTVESTQPESNDPESTHPESTHPESTDLEPTHQTPTSLSGSSSEDELMDTEPMDIELSDDEALLDEMESEEKAEG
jgi:hypothetical protein